MLTSMRAGAGSSQRVAWEKGCVTLTLLFLKRQDTTIYNESGPGYSNLLEDAVQLYGTSWLMGSMVFGGS